ncbi:MAG: N-formylglutamate amidohydrolase [Desulfobacterales bacterium]|nr:N-formylglutamate amidohydrolase [Desulfobacterales bacterium]
MKMQILSEQAIIEKLACSECFKATIESGAFVLRIGDYVPAVFTAIHDGHHVPSYLLSSMLVTEDQRTYEEDPYTGDIADLFSISLRVCDSRYLYDLNRQADECIYDEAWGLKVWKTPPSKALRNTLLERHRSYYRVLHALLSSLEKQFSSCVLYDLHSYNYSRINGNTPLFNIGTHYIDQTACEPVVLHLIKQLRSISLSQMDNRTACDEVFKGRGYQAHFINSNHPQSLCIPLEIKKVFMDEKTFEPHAEMLSKLKDTLTQALSSNAVFFADARGRLSLKQSSVLLKKGAKP